VEQVPALVQADPQRLQSVPFILRDISVGLFLEEFVFLVRKLIDPIDDILVFHVFPCPFSAPPRRLARYPSILTRCALSSVNRSATPNVPASVDITARWFRDQACAVKEFERRVTEVIMALEPGEVATYGDIAEEAGYPRAARAVGNILAESEGLPWWRVVSASGRLVPGHEAEQARRLRSEGIAVDGRRVRLAGRTL
jgi:methylated-DNA-protein-cysteine methyltransferase-like protein